MSSIYLQEAYFCLSCETVTDNAYECPVCTDRMLWPLESWLKRVNDHRMNPPIRSRAPLLKVGSVAPIVSPSRF